MICWWLTKKFTNMTLPTTIIDFIHRRHQLCIDDIRPAKSAQHSVWIIHVTTIDSTRTSISSVEETWQEALRSGRDRLVVRQWKGGARWWNLHEAKHVSELAKSEIYGYSQARSIFNTKSSSASTLRIPLLLYHSHQDASTSSDESSEKLLPWAIFEYVGPESSLFDDQNYLYDESKIQQMIPIRHEFGFDEPHPRWGRLPIEESFNYARMIIDQVVLKLQSHQVSESAQKQTFQYASMVKLYQRSLERIRAKVKQQATGTNERLERWTLMLSRAVDTLVRYSESITPLSPVLVHMDLQPQNILLAARKSTGEFYVRSVLDWEDSALADPRFELLMICRKVVANQPQAKMIWEYYQQHSNQNLGPMEPWLQLETTHSITTLLLQTMNMLDGGRNPWETQADLLGKLDREYQRLQPR